MWLGVAFACLWLVLVLKDRPQIRRMLVGRRRRGLDDRLLAHGLSPSYEHASPDGNWVVHYDGQLGADLPAGARLDTRSLVLSVELTIAHGHLDLPVLERQDAEPGASADAAAAVLFGTRSRRAALHAFFEASLPGVVRRARVAQSTLTLEASLPADSPGATVAHAFTTLRKVGKGALPGLADPLPEQLAEVAFDHELPAPLRECARRMAVVDFPFTEAAQRLARPLLGHRDALVALSAALVVDEPDRIAEAVRTATGPDDLMTVDLSRWRDVLDRARAKLDPDRSAALAPAITHPLVRLGWLEALLRGGYDRPARRALAEDPDPLLRGPLAQATAHEVCRRGPIDFELEQLLLALLEGDRAAAPDAARALAAHGTRRSLQPLFEYRASLSTTDPEARPLAELIDAGLDRIRSGLDPALAGQLSVSSGGEGGGLALADTANGGLSAADAPDRAE